MDPINLPVHAIDCGGEEGGGGECVPYKGIKIVTLLTYHSRTNEVLTRVRAQSGSRTNNITNAGATRGRNDGAANSAQMRWLATILGLLRLACLRAEDNKPLVEHKNRKPYLVTFYVNVDDELDSFEVMVRWRPRKDYRSAKLPLSHRGDRLMPGPSRVGSARRRAVQRTVRRKVLPNRRPLLPRRANIHHTVWVRVCTRTRALGRFHTRAVVPQDKWRPRSLCRVEGQNHQRRSGREV